MTQATTQAPSPGVLKPLSVDQIKAEASIQARVEMDMRTVATYHERMVAGDRFPPIIVFDDGTMLWLADGFHRLAAAKQADRKQIDAWVIDGSHDDAAWFALGANRTNGLPMGTADKVRAIKQALMLRAHESNALIARHVGVSDKTVAKYRGEMESTSEIPRFDKRTGADGKERAARVPVNDDPPPPPPPVVPDEPPSPPRVDPPPSTTDQPPKVPPPPPVIPELPKDRVGNPITDPRMAEIFKRDHELVELCSAVSKVKTTVLKAIEANDPLFVGYVSRGQFHTDAENLRRQIDNLRPYAVCPYCWATQPKVTSCEPCRGRGWVNQSVYLHAPEDRRRGRK